MTETMQVCEPYVVDRHLAEQVVHLLIHGFGSRLQRTPLHQHLSGLVHSALQHVAQHL